MRGKSKNQDSRRLRLSRAFCAWCFVVFLLGIIFLLFNPNLRGQGSPPGVDGGGGADGGDEVSVNGTPTTDPDFVDSTFFTFGLSGNTVYGIADTASFHTWLDGLYLVTGSALLLNGSSIMAGNLQMGNNDIIGADSLSGNVISVARVRPSGASLQFPEGFTVAEENYLELGDWAYCDTFSLDITGNTRMQKNDAIGDLEFTDANTGTKTLAQLAASGSGTSDSVIIYDDPSGGTGYSSVNNLIKVRPSATVTITREDSTTFDVLRLASTATTDDDHWFSGTNDDTLFAINEAGTDTLKIYWDGSIWHINAPGLVFLDSFVTGSDTLNDLTGWGLIRDAGTRALRADSSAIETYLDQIYAQLAGFTMAGDIDMGQYNITNLDNIATESLYVTAFLRGDGLVGIEGEFQYGPGSHPGKFGDTGFRYPSGNDPTFPGVAGYTVFDIDDKVLLIDDVTDTLQFHPGLPDTAGAIRSDVRDTVLTMKDTIDFCFEFSLLVGRQSTPLSDSVHLIGAHMAGGQPVLAVDSTNQASKQDTSRHLGFLAVDLVSLDSLIIVYDVDTGAEIDSINLRGPTIANGVFVADSIYWDQDVTLTATTVTRVAYYVNITKAEALVAGSSFMVELVNLLANDDDWVRPLRVTGKGKQEVTL